MSDKRPPLRPLAFPDRSGHEPSGDLPDPKPDPTLRTLLQGLPIPPASEELDARVMASYRREMSRDMTRSDRSRVLFSVFSSPQSRGARWPFAALIAGCAFASLLAIALQMTSSRVSAAELLEHARKQERQWSQSPDQVIHRMLALEERRHPDTRLLTRRRIEIWHSAASGMQARRVYDERDRLLAGEWRRGDGSSTVYRPRVRPSATRVPRRLPLDAQEIWRWDLSAIQFSQLVGEPRMAAAAVRNEDGTYVVTMNPDADGRIRQASLTLDADFHAREASIVVEHPEGTREYRFSEVTFEEFPPSAVAPQRFEPDAELLGSTEPRKLPLAAAAPAPPAASTFTDVDLDRLELYAAYRLHRLTNCTGPSTTVDRTPSGVRVDATVVSDACHAEATGMLSAAVPGLTVSVRTEEAPIRRQTLVSIDDEALTRTRGYLALHDHFAKADGAAAADPLSPAGDAVRHAIRQVAVWSLTRSQESVRHISVLEQLSHRWSPATLEPLDLETVAMWQAMIRDEARAVAQSAESLRLQLQAPFFLTSPTDDESHAISILDAGDVVAAVQRLAVLVRDTDHLIQQLFTPVEEGSMAPTPDRSALARSLLRTQQQAARFAEPWVLNP